jgi:hypothetical protein
MIAAPHAIGKLSLIVRQTFLTMKAVSGPKTKQRSLGPYLEVFARFRRFGWRQWGNEDVEENSIYGVARRKGHVDPQLRLLQTPRGYGGKT